MGKGMGQHGVVYRHAWHCLPWHGCRLGRGEHRGGDGAVLPLAEAGTGGVIPVFILGSWSNGNWSSSGVQQASGSGGRVLPSHVGTLMDLAAHPGAEGRADPGGIKEH